MVDVSLPDLAEGLAGFQGGASRKFGAEVPAPAAVEWKRILPAGDKIAAVLLQLVQGALQPVEYAAEQPRAKAHRQGTLRGRNRLTDAEAPVVLKDLDRRDDTLKAHDFASQSAKADKHPVTVAERELRLQEDGGREACFGLRILRAQIAVAQAEPQRVVLRWSTRSCSSRTAAS